MTPETSSSTPTIVTISARQDLPITLTTKNFISWCLHLHALLDGLDLMGYLNSKRPRPDPASDSDGSTHWFRQDHLLLAAILGAVSPDILPLLDSIQTFADAWTVLQRAFASTSRAHVMHIKTVLTTITLGSKSVSEYVNRVKALADELGLIDAPISDDDLTL